MCMTYCLCLLFFSNSTNPHGTITPMQPMHASTHIILRKGKQNMQRNGEQQRKELTNVTCDFKCLFSIAKHCHVL